MEIAILSGQTIKIRSKQVVLIIDPFAVKNKTVADVVLFMQHNSVDVNLAPIAENKLTIDGPGEYEVHGVKITGHTIGEDILYSMNLDGIELLLAKTKNLAKAKELLGEYHVAVLQANSLADQSLITALNPHVVVFYGEKKDESAKALGTSQIMTTAKYASTREKLPAEMQVVVLQ